MRGACLGGAPPSQRGYRQACGSSVYWDVTINVHFIFLQAKHIKALLVFCSWRWFSSFLFSFYLLQKQFWCALNTDQWWNPAAICVPIVMLFSEFFFFISHALQIFEIPGGSSLYLHPVTDPLKEYLIRKYCVVCVIWNSMLSFL